MDLIANNSHITDEKLEHFYGGGEVVYENIVCCSYYKDPEGVIDESGYLKT